MEIYLDNCKKNYFFKEYKMAILIIILLLVSFAHQF